MFMDKLKYSEKLKDTLDKYEGLCCHCGSCCGSTDGDHCIHLTKKSDNKYYCKVYKNRIGMQVTVSGTQFACIPIRDFLKFNPPYPKCAYSKGI